MEQNWAFVQLLCDLARGMLRDCPKFSCGEAFLLEQSEIVIGFCYWKCRDKFPPHNFAVVSFLLCTHYFYFT